MRLPDGHEFLVGVSIDGPRDLHDAYRVDRRQRPTFDDVMRGLELLQKHRTPFNTLTVVNRLNSRRPLEVYRFLKRIGSRHLQFIPLVEREPDAQARVIGLDLAGPHQPGAPEVDRRSPRGVWKAGDASRRTARPSSG